MCPHNTATPTVRPLIPSGKVTVPVSLPIGTLFDSPTGPLECGDIVVCRGDPLNVIEISKPMLSAALIAGIFQPAPRCRWLWADRYVQASRWSLVPIYQCPAYWLFHWEMVCEPAMMGSACE